MYTTTMAIVNRKNTIVLANCLSILIMLLLLHCFHYQSHVNGTPIKGSIFTINKNDGNIIFSSKADEFEVTGVEDANKMHANSIYLRAYSKGELYEFSSTNGLNGFKPCKRKSSEFKCTQASLGVDYGDDCILNTHPCRKGLCMGTTREETLAALGNITKLTTTGDNIDNDGNFKLVATLNSHAAYGGPNQELVSWGNFWDDELIAPSSQKSTSNNPTRHHRTESYLLDQKDLLDNGVKQLISNDYAIAALSKEGYLKTWGISGAGGETCSSINIFSPRSTSTYETSRQIGDIQYGYPTSSEETWLKNYQCQITKENIKNTKYIIENLLIFENVRRQIDSLYATKSAFIALTKKTEKTKSRIVPWGNVETGGKLSEYADKKEGKWQNKELIKTIVTNAYSVFVFIKSDKDLNNEQILKDKDEWMKDDNFEDLGTNYMFWGLHNVKDTNVMFNLLDGSYEEIENIEENKDDKVKSYYIVRVHTAHEADIDAFLIEAYKGEERKLLLIGNPKYHRQIMGSDIDAFFGNIKKIVGVLHLHHCLSRGVK